MPETTTNQNTTDTNTTTDVETPVHSISDFITNFKGGTRQNRFLVTGAIGPNKTGLAITAFHVRSATIPAATTAPISINYRGRTVSYSGDREYTPWQITILDDHGGGPDGAENLHKAFHDWQDALNSHETNLTTFPTPPDPSSLWSEWHVKQYNTNCDTVLPGRDFTLYNIWPVSVGDIQLDMSADNTLASFAVTLVYSHYKYDGNAADKLKAEEEAKKKAANGTTTTG